MPTRVHRNPLEETTYMSCDECMMTTIISALSPVYQDFVELFIASHAACQLHEHQLDTTRMKKILKDMPGSSYKDIVAVRVQDPVL